MAGKSRRGRISQREKELALLLSAEQSLSSLRRFYGRPTQRYDFVTETIAQLQAERLTLQRAMQGDADAIRARRLGGSDAAHAVGQ